jgi:sec-independent protein translocase protein TatC
VAEPREHDLEEGRMPFVQHLIELRDRLRNATIAFAVAFIACWYFAKEIIAWLRVPSDRAWMNHADVLGPIPFNTFNKLTEPFWVDMSVAMWAGIFVSSPLVFYQLWGFIAPGLYKRERRIGVLFSFFSAVFFVAGAVFCYYVVLEQLYTYLLGYATQDLRPNLSISEYVDLTRSMMLAFGAVFEMPMLIFFLSMVGLVDHKKLWKFNRWFVVIAFVVGAILTPSPDPITQIMMALPMIVLYNFSIIISWVVTRNRVKREAAARASEGAPPPDDERRP